MHDDEARLQAHLDDHPEDLAARRVLADLLDDKSKSLEATLQRWLADHERWPDSNLTFCNEVGWHWWSQVSEGYLERVHAVVPQAAQHFMLPEEWLYTTRLEAENALLLALQKAGLL